MSIHETIQAYDSSQDSVNRQICQSLSKLIQENITDATNKLWHGGPVWFIDDNPVVGYWVRKNGVALLFWSGQSFDEPDLESEGKFKAAQIKYTDVSQINESDIKRWLKKSHDIQWNYKDIIINKGHLKRISVDKDGYDKSK